MLTFQGICANHIWCYFIWVTTALSILLSYSLLEEDLCFESSSDKSKKKTGFKLFSKVIGTVQRIKNTSQKKNSNMKHKTDIIEMKDTNEMDPKE